MAKAPKEPPAGKEPPEPKAGPELQKAVELKNSTAIGDSIVALFGQLYEAQTEIDDAVATYVEPLKVKRKGIWKQLADTDIERTDLELFFRVYARNRDAGLLEIEADRDRVRRNLRHVFEALKKGEQLGFLDVVDSAAAPSTPKGAPLGVASGYTAQQGREAFKSGSSFETCPFPKGSAARDQWEAGFHEAMSKAGAKGGDTDVGKTAH